MIPRTQLCDRVLKAGPRVLRLIAPAGYGKSTLARELGSHFPSFAVCDCLGVTDVIEFCRKFIAALAAEDPERADNLAQAGMASGSDAAAWRDVSLHEWSAPQRRSLFVFDNAEFVAGNSDVCELLGRLLASGSGERMIAMCSRAALPLQFDRPIPPHEVLTLAVADLRLRDDEIRQAFAGVDTAAPMIARVAEVSRGWAIAVFLLLRLARENRLEAMLDRLDDVAFSDLRDYLSSEVLGALSPHSLDVLLACVAIPGCGHDDVNMALGITDARERLDELAEQLPFLTRLPDGRHEVDPLLATTLRRQNAARCREILKSAAEQALQREHALRAAQLLLALGERDTAAVAFEDLDLAYFTVRPTVDFAATVAEFDEATLTRHPKIWATVMMWRAGSIEPHERLRQCEAMWRALSPDADRSLRGSIAGAYFGALVNLGRLADAERLLDEFRAIPDLADRSGNPVGEYLRVSLDIIYHGRFEGLDGLSARLTPTLLASDASHALFLAQLVGSVHVARGEFAEAAAALEHAIELAYRSGGALLKATVLFGAIQDDWIAGDDAAFERHVALFEALMDPAIAKFGAFFIAAARGRARGVRPGYETLERATFGYLMAAAAATGEQRIEFARLALKTADASSRIFLRVIGRVALGESVVGERRRLLKEAAEIAGSMQSTPLHEALAAVRAGAGDFGMLEPLVRRFRTGADVAVDAARARALPTQSPLSKREREVAVLVAAGKSNREIGEALVISERTVENHVASIFNKLGIGSRAALAAYVGSGGQGLPPG